MRQSTTRTPNRTDKSVLVIGRLYMNELGEFHHAEDRPDKTKKIVGAVAIALIIAGAAFYVVHSGMLHPAPKSTVQAYPRGL